MTQDFEQCANVHLPSSVTEALADMEGVSLMQGATALGSDPAEIYGFVWK